MKVLIHQFAVAADPSQNLRVVEDVVAEAKSAGARLALLPEGIISRDPENPDATAAGAQPLDGPFVTKLKDLSSQGVAIAATVHITAPDGRTSNIGIVCDGGEVVHTYDKLHLYDAFAAKESDRVAPGNELPTTFELDGVTFGMLTCYDVRFPEPSRLLASAGADVLLLPAAWVRGPLKEDHWKTMVTARALENTMYVLASGECSVKNCGLSMAVDPLGVTIASAAEAPKSIIAEIDLDRIAQSRAALPVLANRRFADPVLAD